MGRIRPFTDADVSAVAELRRRVFRSNARRTPAELEDYLRRIFLLNPFVEDDLRSFVYEHEGAVKGFVGVIPRPAVCGGAPIRVAVSTQFMMDPEIRGLPALQMVRHLFAGPQDLTLADAGPAAIRRLWVGLGGETAWPYSMTWEARPAQVAAAGGRRQMQLLGRIVAGLPGGLGAGRLRDPGVVVEAVRPDEVAAVAASLIAAPLAPRYDGQDLGWVIRRAAEKEGARGVVSARVRDRAGDVLGWFVYRIGEGRSAWLFQLGARVGEGTRVIRALAADAAGRAVRRIGGAADPALLPDYDSLGISVERRGPWTLVQSRRPDVLAPISRGEAWLSGLDGERWLSF